MQYLFYFHYWAKIKQNESVWRLVGEREREREVATGTDN